MKDGERRLIYLSTKHLTAHKEHALRIERGQMYLHLLLKPTHWLNAPTEELAIELLVNASVLKDLQVLLVTEISVQTIALVMECV